MNPYAISHRPSATPALHPQRGASVSHPLSVSVIIAAWNNAATIGDALNALLHQIDPPIEREIIVVDNGSIDQTREIIQRFPVTLLTEAKLGQCAARNCGLRAARGEVLAYLDADALPTRTWLREIVKPFQNPATILVGGQTVSFAPATPAQRYRSRAGVPRFEYRLFRVPFPFMAARNLAVRRECVSAIGGWDEDLRACEDADFCFRLRRRFSAPHTVQASAVVFHRDRDTIEAMGQQARAYGKGWAQVYRKYPEVVHWDFLKSMQVAGYLTVRSIAPLILRVRKKFRAASDDQIEFADCHRLWSQSFWRGFFDFRRQHREV